MLKASLVFTLLLILPLVLADGENDLHQKDLNEKENVKRGSCRDRGWPGIPKFCQNELKKYFACQFPSARRYCKKSCNLCSGCTDKPGFNPRVCRFYKSNNLCGRGFAQTNCPKTCGKC
eukprot:TCONS_00063832-protein